MRRFSLLIALFLALFAHLYGGVKKPKSLTLYQGAKAVKVKVSEINRFDEEEYGQFLKAIVKPRALVFDVGANIGKYAKVYLDSVAEKIVCFEPQPLCVEKLREAFGATGRVSIEAIGLAEKSGTLELFQCEAADTISTFSPEYLHKSRFADHGYKWEKKISVPISTLDLMIQKHGLPDFCKIDVENYEEHVLQGLSQKIALVSFECNIENLEHTKRCLALLSKLGYREFNFAVGERGLFLSKKWLSDKELLELIETISSGHDLSAIWGLWGDIFAR